MDITDIIRYITIGLSGIVGLIMLSRILRIFPTYVKTGSIGDIDHMLMGDGFSIKWFLTETHPVPIVIDTLMSAFIIFILFIVSTFAPIMFIFFGGAFGIFRLAIHMRKQYLRKVEFIDALKGD